MRSPSRIASFRSCVTKTIVRSISSRSRSSRSCISRRISGSSAENGSSISSTSASVASARQPDALLHPARQLRRPLVAPVAEADLLQRLLGPLAPLPPREPADLQPVAGVVAHALVRQQREVLEDHRDPPVAHLAQLGRRQRREVAPVERDRAGGRLDEPVEHPQHRRLARARQPHQHVQLAPADGQRDVPDGDGAAPARSSRARRLRSSHPRIDLRSVLGHPLSGDDSRVLSSGVDLVEQRLDLLQRDLHVSDGGGESRRALGEVLTGGDPRLLRGDRALVLVALEAAVSVRVGLLELDDVELLEQPVRAVEEEQHRLSLVERAS